jgi:hypothetical protein
LSRGSGGSRYDRTSGPTTSEHDCNDRHASDRYHIGQPAFGKKREATVERVRISDEAIEVRPLLPRGNTVFHVSNESASRRTVAISARDARPSWRATLDPGDVVCVQVNLSEAEYSIEPGAGLSMRSD